MERAKSIYGVMMAMATMLAMPSYAQQENSKVWKELPVISITSVNGEMPTATKVYPPEGCVGESILSEHVPGKMVMTVEGDTVYDSGDYKKGESGMRFTIRGNTTGANLLQHPYKLKLSKKADLLSLGKDSKNKDFALLAMHTWNTAMTNEESNILPIVGLAVCEALDMPWEPKTMPVDVVINDKYQGVYHLIESVSRADKRINTDDDGFVIENDAYWWKPGEAYFRTSHQEAANYMGFTFKYPDGDDLTEEQNASIKSYMERVEDAIYNEKGASDLIDYKSFARWILAHDMLGSWDAAGSNMYLYCVSMGKNDDDSKLRMATLWDFDSSFMSASDDWSQQHWSYLFYYLNLFHDADFVKTYLDLYDKYKDTVYPYVENRLNDFRTTKGEAFEHSLDKHRATYGDGQCFNSLDVQINDVLTHMKARMEGLKTLMANLKGQWTAMEGVSSVANPSLVARSNAYGVDCTGIAESSLRPGIYIERYSDGTVKKVLKQTK